MTPEIHTHAYENRLKECMASLQSAAIMTKVLLTEHPHVHPAGSYPQSSAQRRCECEEDNSEN